MRSAQSTLLLVPFGVRNTNRFFDLARRTRVLIGNTIGSGMLRNPGEVVGRLPSMEYFATTRIIDFSEMNKKGPLKAWAD